MTIVNEKKVSILSDSIYQFGKTQKDIKEALKLLGASVVSDYDKSDYVILGNKNHSLHFLSKKNNVLVETELIEKAAKHFNYFEGVEQKLFDMLRRLISMDNITVDMFEVGPGVTEKEFGTIEKKLKKSIPASIKEFYSVFGYIKILWHFKNPPISYREIYQNSLYLHSGQHNGCINILPLKKTLFGDWKDPELCFGLPEEKDIRLFDLYSDYHIMGYELADNEDPKVYLGSDHGVSFELINDLTFSDYIKRIIGIYGYLNRFTNTSNWIVGGNGYIFNQFSVEDIEDNDNKTKSIEGFVEIDSSNNIEVDKFIKRSIERIDELKQSGDYAKAINTIIASSLWKHDISIFPKIRELIDLILNDHEKNIDYSQIIQVINWSSYWEHDINIYQYLLDICTIEDDSNGYFENLNYAIEDGFNLSEYENKTKYSKFIKMDKYQEIKKTLPNNK